MNVLSLFSGVGGLDLGLERAGHNVIAQCEIDKNARGVLAQWWPDTPIHHDVTTLDGRQYAGRTHLVCGGSPCQDLSVAGRRDGLDGERSGLFWEQCRIATESAARWVVWENVAGALSSNTGHDFAAVLWGLTGTLPEVPEDGWRSTGLCVGSDRTAVWRMFDAQWFGVAQRRRRVFVVAGPRNECGPEVLALAQSVSGHPRPSREEREDVAGCLGGGSGSRGWAPDTDRMTFIPWQCHGSNVGPMGTLRKGNGGVTGGVPFMAFDWTQTDMTVRDDVVHPLSVGSSIGIPSVPAVAYPLAMRGRSEGAELEMGEPDVYNSLRAGDGGSSRQNAVLTPEPAVRRLTPVECERLMGWPDNHTEGQADSHRYKQCGNGVVSACAEWIGRRLPITYREGGDER